MGDPKKTKKKFVRPRRPWDKTRLDEERILKETHGLKNKKELWMLQHKLKNKRQNARKLLALELEQRIQREKELVDSLKKIGILKENASLDDVLGLKIEEFLERRLQTIVWRKGLANTPKQARQFIVHGHIAVKGKKITVPSYTVKAEEENNISYYGKEMKIQTEKEASKKSLSKNEKDLEKEFEEPEPFFEKKEPKTEKETPKAKEKKETPKKEEIAKKTEKKEVKKEKTEEKIAEEKTEDKKIQKEKVEDKTKEKETKEEKKIEDTKEKKEHSKKEEIKEENKEEDTKEEAETEKEGAEK